jgi:hypothetical protein
MLFILIIERPTYSNPSNKSTIVMSVLEAYHFGKNEAQKWDTNAKLYLLSSIDGDPGSELGYSGKRRYWNMVFAVPGFKKSLIITIHDKKIISTIESNDETNDNEVLSSVDNFKMDSTDAILIARKQLRPGNIWTNGYHFILSKSGNIVLLEVVGADQNNKIKRLYFNAITGKMI